DLRFGRAAIVQGVKTPMQDVDFYEDYYIISLEGISLGSVRLFNLRGLYMLLDTGSSVSHLPGDIYDKLVAEMRKKIVKSFTFETVERELCVKASKWSELKEIMPTLTFHIAGFDYKLSTENTWYSLNDVNLDEVYCLAIQRDDPGVQFALLGAYQMQSINVGFDLGDREIYFETTVNCD
ncbi:hypothetical protein MKW92_007091, partial [Papaver armeniacum]